MLSTILSYALAVAIILFLSVVSERLTRKNALLEKQVHDLQELVSAVNPDSEQEPSLEQGEFGDNLAEKPVTVESIRTALQFNGISPEPPGSDDRSIILFTVGETHFRIVATNLPFLSIEMGFYLDRDKEDLSLLRQGAAEITASTFIGKACIVGNGEAIIYSTELLCDSYAHFRDNLKQYLHILHDTYTKVHDTYDKLKEQKKADMEAVFSGRGFIRENGDKSS